MVGDHFPAEADRIRSPRDKRFIQGLNQVGPVNMEIVSAPAIDRGLAERNVEQELATAAHTHFQGFRPECILENTGRYTELAEHLHAVGTKLDARADLIQHAGLLEDENVMSEMIERQSGSQAPNASACYQDPHSDTSLIILRRSSRPRGILLTADQDESAVAILALDEIIIAHLIPDARMPQRAAAAIARDPVAGHHRDFRRVEHIAFRGHEL